METNGVAGRIQVTKKVVEIVTKEARKAKKQPKAYSLYADIRFEKRGTISVKGKGEMEAFLLVN